MAIYNLIGAGNVDAGHLNRLNDDVGAGHGYVPRVAYLVSRAVDNYPWNQAPTQALAGDWAITRGFRMIRIGHVGNWEGHILSGQYRLDFQGYTNDGFYANWQIQWGHGQHNGGTASHVLVRLGHTFSIGQLIHAFRHSARNAQSCQLTM